MTQGLQLDVSCSFRFSAFKVRLCNNAHAVASHRFSRDGCTVPPTPHVISECESPEPSSEHHWYCVECQLALRVAMQFVTSQLNTNTTLLLLVELA